VPLAAITDVLPHAGAIAVKASLVYDRVTVYASVTFYPSARSRRMIPMHEAKRKHCFDSVLGLKVLLMQPADPVSQTCRITWNLLLQPEVHISTLIKIMKRTFFLTKHLIVPRKNILQVN
jgi:hypothetical protein